MTIAGVTGTEVCVITDSINIEDYIDNNIKAERQSFCQIVPKRETVNARRSTTCPDCDGCATFGNKEARQKWLEIARPSRPPLLV
jgi:hypothetical protein